MVPGKSLLTAIGVDKMSRLQASDVISGVKLWLSLSGTCAWNISTESVNTSMFSQNFHYKSTSDRYMYNIVWSSTATMASIRRVTPLDLLKLNLCNLDPLTENYDMNFYMTYLMKWPSLFMCIEEHGHIVGYIMGKVESSPTHMMRSPHALPWHGHITVLTVAPQYRRQGYARLLTEALEKQCDQKEGWFIDLYVRASNSLAIGMYRKMGYSVYRRVVDYYNDDPTGQSKTGSEDAFDMRKPLSRDKKRKHIRENGEDHRVSAEDVF